MMRLFFIGLLLCASTSATAAPCQLGQAQTVLVKSVIDGDTVKLNTGQYVRLVGIQAPKLPLGRKNYPTWPLALDSKKALEKLVLNKRVTLKFGGRKSDRHGRKLAHIFIGSEWVQKNMVRSGLARVYSFSDNRSCVEDLLKIEARSRAKKQGIWAHSFYRIRNAENIEKLSALHNSFQLVRGKVLATGSAGGKIYLNFGRNWKTDFTGVVARRHWRHFKKSGMDLKGLKGRTIRVRGWLGFHNGPKIDLSHPEQIEILTSH